MDGYEATRIVFSRIQSLDPDNASKIMGLLLLQDHGEKEMIRLAFGTEATVQSVISKVKKELGLASSPSTPSSPSPFVPNQNQRQNSLSSRLNISNTSILPSSLTIPNPCSLSSTSSTSSWSDLPNQDDLISPSSGSMLNPASLPFYGNGGRGLSVDIVNDFHLQDQLSFLNDNNNPPTTHLVSPKSTSELFYSQQQQDLSSSPPVNSSPDSMLLNSYWGGLGSGSGSGSVHRRSYSVSDVLGSDDPASGFGWRPCLYYARGYCKNGSNCRFVHSEQIFGDGCVGSPSKIEMMDQELLRSKSASSQQQRLAAAAAAAAAASQLMNPYSPKSINFLLQHQQNDTQRAAAAAALLMGEDLHKLGRSRLERNDFSMNGNAAMASPASRQIYLTFPADSTFKEEDVSNYFSNYGPVQDVRIPYQQKRMFGFVTFVYPETVKLILAKGNPHFVCDARVLVKPYKEKGKVPDKFRKQQTERSEFSSPCGTPTGLDHKDPFDLQLGARMLYNNAQDILWRRKLEEQADLQLQSRRLMNLQLLDVKRHHHHRAFSTGSTIPSPTQIHSPNLFNLSPFHTSPDSPIFDNCSSPLKLPPISVSQANTFFSREYVNGNNKGNNNLPESLDHNLPDSPFASPAKACAAEFLSAFDAAVDSDKHNASSPSNNNSNSVVDIASFKSCQIPRFSSSHGPIGMYASGNGGPTCPVGI